MTDVVLIHPGAAREIYQGLSENLAAIEPPTWTRMIAGWLRDHGFSVKIIDQEAENFTDEQVLNMSKGANVVAICVYGHQPNGSTQQMIGAHRLAVALKDLQKTRVIMLGDHVSALPEKTLFEEPVDYVCDGEGPQTIAGLCNRARAKASIPGLVYWDEGMIKSTPTAPLIPIDELHGDVWDLLPMEKYRAHNWHCFDGSPRQPYASIYTTLGCPFKCHFCMINVFQHSNTYRRRTPSKVVEQVRLLYNAYGVTTLRIADEMFVLDPSHYIPICEGLAALPFSDELNIWAYARVDTIKPETLSLLRRAGIRWLCLGIESGSAHVRDGAKKTLDGDDIRNAVNSVQNAGINVLGNFMYGLPDDTMESMSETLRLSKSLEVEYANYYSAMPYPGSRLFDETPEKDLPTSWAGYSQHSYETQPLPTKTLTAREVLKFRDDAFREYFSDSAYIDLVRRKFGDKAAKDIEEMTSYQMKRALLDD